MIYKIEKCNFKKDLRMGLFNFGKKKKEQEPTCACNTPVDETKEEKCCCCAEGDSLVSIKVLGSGCKSCHELYENTKEDRM